MRNPATLITFVSGALASAGAVGAAVALGGLHEAASISTPEALLAGVAVGALLHLPGHFAIKLFDAASHRMEARVDLMMQGGGPAANEDALRAGRDCALRGLGAVVDHLAARAKIDPDHDRAAVRRFRREVKHWIHAEQQLAYRRDRPDSEAWTKPGFGLEAIDRPMETPAARIRELEAWAWDELAGAMAQRGVAVPKTFRPYFEGDAHCGLGWRRAGHLFLMHELKTNSHALVGYQVDYLSRLERKIDALTLTRPGLGPADMVVARPSAAAPHRPVPPKPRRPPRVSPDVFD